MALFLSISFGGGLHDLCVVIQLTPLSFLLWKLTTKMRNLLSTAAPHQGPGQPGFYLYSLKIFASFVPSFLSNQRLWVGIRNDLVPSSNSSISNSASIQEITDKIHSVKTDELQCLNPLLGSDSFILVLLNIHTEVMDIELGDHSIQNIYDDYDYYDDYVYLQALQELCGLLNDFHPIRNEKIDYYQKKKESFRRILLYLRF